MVILKLIQNIRPTTAEYEQNKHRTDQATHKHTNFSPYGFIKWEKMPMICM